MGAKKKGRKPPRARRAAAVARRYTRADSVEFIWEVAVDKAKENDGSSLVRMLETENSVPMVARAYLVDLVERRLKPPARTRGPKARPDAQRILSTYVSMTSLTKDELSQMPVATQRMLSKKETVKDMLCETFGIERKALDEIIYPRRRTGKKQRK